MLQPTFGNILATGDAVSELALINPTQGRRDAVLFGPSTPLRCERADLST
jgi:hypothetical protein